MPPHGFSSTEKAQCVLWVAEGYRGTAVQRKFRTKYNREPPSRAAIAMWRADYENRGTHAHRGGNGRPQINAQTKATITTMFQENPRISLRFVSQQVGVCHATVGNFIRKELGLFPYKLQTGVQLSAQDRQNRLAFAHYCQRELRSDPMFLKRIVFSDECCFSLSGFVNKQNTRIWGSERPAEVYETPQNTPSVMVWCAVSQYEIIGPYFFQNETVTGDRYKSMLVHYVFPKLRDYPDSMLFQQDGAPPHYAVTVRQYLDRKLPNRWIGRGGPIAWPARSPDLTACDYFLWGYVKDLVYRELPNTMAELKKKIKTAITGISDATLSKVYKNMKNRILFVQRQNGGHFEHLFN